MQWGKSFPSSTAEQLREGARAERRNTGEMKDETSNQVAATTTSGCLPPNLDPAYSILGQCGLRSQRTCSYRITVIRAGAWYWQKAEDDFHREHHAWSPPNYRLAIAKPPTFLDIASSFPTGDCTVLLNKASGKARLDFLVSFQAKPPQWPTDFPLWRTLTPVVSRVGLGGSALSVLPAPYFHISLTERRTD